MTLAPPRSVTGTVSEIDVWPARGACSAGRTSAPLSVTLTFVSPLPEAAAPTTTVAASASLAPSSG